MDISFYCFKCGQHIVIDEAGAGLQVPCPKCGESLQVPACLVTHNNGVLSAVQTNQSAVQSLHDWIDGIEKGINTIGGFNSAGMTFNSLVSLAPLYWKAENAIYASIIGSFHKSMSAGLVAFADGDDRATNIRSLLGKWTQIIDSRSVTQADYFDFFDDFRLLAQGNPHFLKPEIDNFNTPLDALSRIEALVGKDALERRLAQVRSRIFIPHIQLTSKRPFVVHHGSE